MLGYVATSMQQVDNDILADTEYLVFGFVYSLMLVFYYWLDQDVFLQRSTAVFNQLNANKNDAHCSCEYCSAALP